MLSQEFKVTLNSYDSMHVVTVIQLIIS